MVKHIASAKTILIFLLFWIPNIVDGQCLRSGTKTIPGNYATLTAAIADLQANGLAGPVILELQAGYTSATETFPITMGAINCASAINTITIRPAVGSGNLTITSANATATMQILPGNYWIIDGRQGGIGSTSSLTIANTSGGISSSTLSFRNGASNNTVEYVSLSGTCPSQSTGVILFSSTSSGNNNNLIDHCNINGNGSAVSPSSNVAQNGIYATSIAASPNINNTVSNCNIFDCYKTVNGGTTSSGITLVTGNSDWTFQSNSFYYTTTKTGTIGTATVYGINIQNASGNNFQILNNFFGGNAPLGAGTMTMTGITVYKAMNLLVGTITPTSIQGNTIKSININSTVAPPFEGIATTNGNYNIGDVAGNLFGSLSGNGNITLTTNNNVAATAESKGIYINPSITGVTNISNNIFSSFTLLGNTTSAAHGFLAISNKSNTTIISNNIIGGFSLTSINATTASVSGTVQQVVGIISTSTSSIISNNVVRNMNNNWVPLSSGSPAMRGIVLTGSGTVSGNLVHNLYCGTLTTGSGQTAAIIGIQEVGSGSGAVTISENSIYSLAGTNSSSAVSIVGLNYNSSTNPGLVSKNYIHGFTSASNSSILTGIYITNGISTYQNNMIGLGYDTLGNSYTRPNTITGIWEFGTTNNFYNNTVYIGGTSVTNTATATYAYNSSINTRDIRNNIFINARSNATTGGKHYAIQINGTTTGLTLDYNIYQATGTGGVFGRFNSNDVADLNAWRTAVGKDFFSKSVSPCLANPETGFPDLHLTDCGGAGNPADMTGNLIGSVTDDIDNELRSSFTPTDIGADAVSYNVTSSLGSYPLTSVIAGKNVTISPASAPVNIGSLSIIKPAKFSGIITLEQSTGIVNVTDARPAGTFVIVIKSNTNLIQTITLNVTNPNCSRANFISNTTVTTGFQPVSIAIGDFNRDGNQDFVTANDSSANVSVCLGNGLGGVISTTNFSVGTIPKSVAVGDFNNDGKQDLVVANSSSNNVSVLLGNGLGSFSSSSLVSVGNSPTSIAVGEFNGDGFQDIAVANFGGTTVSIRLGNGVGGFSGTTEISVGTQPVSVALDDFNGDAKQDLVVGRSGGGLSINLGNGSGNFTASTTVSGGPQLAAITLGDFNADGNQDIASFYGNDVAIRNGNGAGGIINTIFRSVDPNGSAIAAGDFNGDGNQDIVASSGSFNTTTLIGNGSSGISTVKTNVDTGSSPSALAVGDFNNDGLQDIAITYKKSHFFRIKLGVQGGINISSNSFSISNGSVNPIIANNTDFGLVPIPFSSLKFFQIQNNGSASSTINSITITGPNASNFLVSGISFPYSISQGGIVGFNIDCIDSTIYGLLTATVHVNYTECTADDYDFAIQATGVVPVLSSYPNTTVTAGGNVKVQTSSAPYAILDLTATASGNFKGLISADPITGEIRITNAKPAGTYTITVYPKVTAVRTFTLTVTNPICTYASFTRSESTTNAVNYPYVMLVADFNNDNIQDYLWNYAPLFVGLGNGSGGFTNAPTINLAGEVTGAAVADFNGDGNMDIASILQYQNFVYINLGHGDGTFEDALSYSLINSPNSIATGDFNGDGNMDVIFPMGDVNVYLGDGTGAIYPYTTVNVGNNPYALDLGDVNNDGKLDFVTANLASSDLSVRLGDGFGNFTGTFNIPVSYPQKIQFSDFNNDGNLDIVVQSASFNLSIFLGNGTGNFSLNANLITTGLIQGFTLGDYNGDGKTDIAIGANQFSSTSIYIGTGTGNFNNLAPLGGFYPNNVLSGDFNNDGIQDIAGMNYAYNKFILYLGNTNSFDITGNGNIIQDGSNLISTSNNTDFGIAPLNNSLSKQFTIINRGVAPITFSSITLSGTNAADYSVSGITFPYTIAGNDSTKFYINCTPTSIGIKSAVVHVNNSGCLPNDYDFTVQANGVVPTLGNYLPATVKAGGNISITPSAAPTNTPYLYVTSSSTFKGILSADPITGIVKIVDAKPAGTYTVTVKIGSVIKSFTLTIANPFCSQTVFQTSTTQIYNYGRRNLNVGDFNGDGIQDLIAADWSDRKIQKYSGDGSGGFGLPETIYLSHYTHSLAIGDVNGDGRQDVVMTDSTQNKASVILGDSLGSFVTSSYLYAYNPEVTVGSQPISVALADFNLDGKLDLATANRAGNSVSVRLGNGSGGFSGITEVSVGTSPNQIVVGDFNADGNADFATANYGSNNVSIRLGNGSGGFTGLSNFSVDLNPNSIALADFNNDGKTDFATANYTDATTINSISICIGNGIGGFGSPSTVSVHYFSTPHSILSGDFNGDGKQDLAVSNGAYYNNGNDLSLYLGNGAGSFSTLNNIYVGDGVAGLALGDFNNDGVQDMACVGTIDFTILKGKISGINVIGNSSIITDGSTTPILSDNTDFGIVPISSSTSHVFTIKNNGFSALTISSITITGANQSSFSLSGITLPLTIPGNTIKTFSINCLSSVSGIKTATIHVNYSECTTGDYDFAIKANVLTPTLGNYPASVVSTSGNIKVLPTAVPSNVQNLYVSTSSKFTGQLTADPLTGNIYVTNAKPAGTYSINVTSGNVTKTFTLTVNPNCSQGVFTYPQNPYDNYPGCEALGDFNGDGHQDYVVIPNMYNAPAYIQFGDGLGGFTAGSTTVVSTVNKTIEFVVADDFNGDGKDDIALAGIAYSTFEVRLGDGVGGFSAASSFPVTGTPSSISKGDFNSDGKTDLIIACQGGANVFSVYLGDGNGSFSWSSDIFASSPHLVGIADFNNDGKADLAIPNVGIGTVSIKLGNGLGGFSGSTSISVGANPISIQTGDFNNDGKQDFITSNGYNPSSTYSVRLGNGTGGFTGVTNPTLPYEMYNIELGDFNGDNNLDFSGSTWIHGTVIIRFGNGAGTFSGSLELADDSINTGSHLIGDFNEDKIQDILAFNVTGDLAKQTSLYFGIGSEINLIGNNNNIPDGSISFAVSNNTDFGTTNGSPSVLTYTIQSTGDSSFTVNSITKNGTNPSDFIISGITLPLIVPGHTSVDFNITFTPLSSGVRSAVIHINNTDCNEGDYDFAVRGTYCVAPTFTTCPSNQNVTATTGFCRQTVNYNVTQSGIPTPTISTTFTGATSGTVSGNGSGTTFNTGVTHVIITATNLCNVTTCSFDITVASSVDDNDVCTSDNCNSSTGVISHLAVNTNDNNACTTDGCHSINGIFHNAVNVYDNDSCTVDGCNTSSGVFHNPVNTNDNNLCTTDGCHSVTGVFHNPVNTDDNNACTTDGCISSSGIYHNPVSTDDQNVCTDDGCISTSGVYHNSINIDDGNTCTDDACHSTNGVTHTPVLVDDNDIYTQDGCDSITGIYHHPIFTLKVFIEGYYSGNGLMDNDGAGGCLKVTHLSSNNTDVDTLQLTLVDATTLLPVASSKAILQTDGYAEFIFTSAIPGNVYLKVNQRNSIETWSSVSLSISSHSYDFTINANQAYGNNLVEVFDHLGYAFYSGDVCNSANQSGVQDGIVNNHDFLLVEQAVFDTYLGYVVEDLTGDGMVESSDYVLSQNNWYYNYVVIKP